MKSHLVFGIILISTLISCSISKKINMSENNDPNFKALWSKIDSLDQQGLYKSASEIVDSILVIAKSKGLTDQKIKSFFYKAKYNNTLEENNFVNFERLIKDDIANSNQPEKSIMQSILAQFYDNYLSANLWKINEITDIDDEDNPDILSWSKSKFIRESNKLYDQSIADKSLKNLSYNSFSEIFTKPENSEEFRQSLYEILANRALDHYSNDLNYLPSNTEKFRIENKDHFSIPDVFIHLNISSTNTEDPKYKTLILFQELEKNSLEKNDYNELLDICLKRLSFVKNQYFFEDGPGFYLETLDKLIQKYPQSPIIAEAYYQKATEYFNLGNDNPEQNKWKLKEALKVCDIVIEKYPATAGANYCTSLRRSILEKEIECHTEKVNLPGENIISMIEYKNIDKVYFKLIPANENTKKDMVQNRSNQCEYLNSLPVLRSWHVDLPVVGDYRNHSLEAAIDPLPIGEYILISSTESNFLPQNGIYSYTNLHVSNLAHWLKKDNSGNYIFVVDRSSGAPLENVKVSFFQQIYNYQNDLNTKSLVSESMTNKEGFVNAPETNANNFQIILSKDNDILDLDNFIYTYKSLPAIPYRSVMFFTDRSIYRPGQTVYFKGLMLSYDQESMPSVVKNNNEVNIEFLNSNMQKIGSLSLTTSDFGTFNGSFVIPGSGLTGLAYIKELSTNISYLIKVEEYKRPKFEVKFEDYKDNYKLGDKIKIKGIANSFNGFPIQNAKVSYTVKRNISMPYCYSYRIMPIKNNDLEIANGTLLTDENGNFLVPLELFASDIDKSDKYLNYEFIVNADVTDMSGESHSASVSISANKTTVNIDMQIPEKIRINQKLPITISATNNNGEKTNVAGTINIYKLKEPGKIFRERFWKKPDTTIYTKEEFYSKFPDYAYKTDDEKNHWEILTKCDEFDFNTENNQDYPRTLDNGEYKILLNFRDEDGKMQSSEKFVSVYSEHKNPFNEIVVVDTDKNKYDIPSSLNINWQSVIPGLNVYNSIGIRNNETIDQNWSILNKNLNKTIDLKEKHRGGLVLNSTFVFNNRFYNLNNQIDIPWSNKELSFEYLFFRSQLYPGQDEEWRIKVKGENSASFITEILASMYDASLDYIYQNDWTKSIYFPVAYQNPSIQIGFQEALLNKIYPPDDIESNNIDFNRIYRDIDWFGFNLFDGYGLFGQAAGRPMLANSRYVEYKTPNLEDSRILQHNPEGNDDKEISGARNNQKMKGEENHNSDTNPKQNDQNNPKLILRTNLNETVFFYPQILSDPNGDFVLKFKMNEALTKWKLRMFAHTPDLKIAYGEKEIITQKDIMITPNNPRFVRRGDKLIFNLKIQNLSDKQLSGESWVELLNPADMQVLNSQIISDDVNKTFIIGSKNSTIVSWVMNFNNEIPDVLIYRFYAKSGNISDAEEGYLPVIANQKLITETLPLWVRGNENRTFTLQSLKNSASQNHKNISYTIEATSNPLWLCVQALPYVKDIKYENAISLANGLFTNSLASKINSENPQIRRVFEKWKNSSSKVDREAFMSSLNKNQELKNIILEETPWVLDSKDEEEQKRNIALLFDINQIETYKKKFISHLAQFQNSDGGFTWMKGGKSNRYVSQYVLEIFGKLKRLQAYDEDTEIKGILIKAVTFVNDQVIKDYKNLLKLASEKKVDLEKYNVVNLDIHYLYTIQLYPEVEKNDELKGALIYYKNQMTKYINDLPLSLKAIAALIINRDGDKDKAMKIVEALEEQSINNPELGRYWKANDGYYWWQLPIETQSLLIEAFNEIKGDQNVVDELKIWLIKNKQTNSWKTDKATVSAIYSLLLNDKSSLSEVRPLTLYIDKKNVTSELANDEIQAGTGYFKKRWEGKDVKADMAEVKISNPNDNIAWGAIYWQYMLDLDKIQSFEETSLKLSRELYLVKNTNQGEKMDKILPNQKLEPGDIVRVKIRLETDRSMEFVHLSDQRAASFEPVDQISQYNWMGGLGYYMNPRDTKMNFFIDYLPKGVFVFEYSLRATQSGKFSNGVAELQCYYAPEFSSHSSGCNIEVR